MSGAGRKKRKGQDEREGRVRLGTGKGVVSAHTNVHGGLRNTCLYH